MIYKKLTKKKIIIISIVALVVIGGIAGYVLTRPKNNLANKPNPTPGSGKATASTDAKEAEQKQQAKSQALNKQLAEAPKDPKVRCEITAKFNAENMREDNIALENKRHDEYIKKFGNNNAEEYIHKQNLERVQKQYDRSLKSISCD